MKQIRTLLYYPYTNIPDGKWLRNSLLYTDKITSILPYDMGNKRIPQITKFLFDEGMYEPIYASEELADDPNIENFQNNFLETLESTAFGSINKKAQIFNTGEYNSMGEYVMYANKLTPDIEQYLRDHHLLQDTKNSSEVVMEKNTALLYMSMLADHIARKHKGIIPSTDTVEFQKLAFQSADQKTPAYILLLDKCLPGPLPDVKIEDIVKFKKKRENELRKFRQLLYSYEGKLYLANDDYMRNLIMLEFQNKIQNEIVEIKKLLGDSKLDFVLNGFSALLDFKQKDIFVTMGSLGLAGASVIASLPLIGLGAGALLLMGTLVSSFKNIKKEVEASASSYIYYGQQEGLVEQWKANAADS